MHISITRLKLRHIGLLPAFTYRNYGIVRQLRGARGFLGGQTGVEGLLTYWTLTGWSDEVAMKEFRNHQAHGSAMPKLMDWCEEAAVAQTTGDNLLSWEETFVVLRDRGRTTPLRHPSPRHAAQKTVPDQPHFLHAFTTPIKPHPAI